MAGGYRQGSGRSKSGYYKGIYCGSTYELCWVIYSLDHQIVFDRFQGKLERDGITYYPDFILSDGKTIIETKGYEKQESVDKKTLVAESFGYNVKVLRKKDLEYAFEYVEKTYGTKKFYELYDGYKPKYKHICDHCSVWFETDRKVKSQIKFCTRVCAGRYRNKQNFSDNLGEKTKKKISNSLLGKKVTPYKRKHKLMWITNGSINTKIREEIKIPEGFRRGRI